MSRGPSKRDERLREEALVQKVLQSRRDEMTAKANDKSSRLAVDYLAKQEFALERMEKISERFSKRTWIPKYQGKKTKYVERRVNLILSDLHYGSDLDPKLVTFPYFAVQEARRTAAVCAQVADYKRQYRAETELEIHLIGDIIQGKLHDIQNAADLTRQYDRALHCLIYGIEFLATEFRKVIVRTSVGNHGRDAQRHPERAMQDKYDSNEFRIYRAMKYRFAHVPNIEMHTPMRGYYMYDQFGMKGVMTHGDTIFNPGYPGKMVDVQKLSTQINAFKLAHPQNQEAQLFGMGHVHTAMDVAVGSNTIVTNGCLIPTDEYAQSIGIYNTQCSQQLWETVPGHMFGDHRVLRVGKTHDDDSSLDKIIPTWKDLEG